MGNTATPPRLVGKDEPAVNTSVYTPPHAWRNNNVPIPNSLELEWEGEEHELSDGEVLTYAVRVVVDMGSPDTGPSPWEAGEAAYVSRVLWLLAQGEHEPPNRRKLQEIVTHLEGLSGGRIGRWIQERVDEERDTDDRPW